MSKNNKDNENKIMARGLVFDKETQSLKPVSFYLVRKKGKRDYFDIVKKGE